MADNLIFPIGFDLEKAVNEAGQQWDKKYAKRLEDFMAKRPVRVKLDFEKLEDVKKRLAQLKIEPITPETKTAIKELARELQTLAKALEQVQKYSTARASASPDAVRASKIRVNEERAQAQAALAAQRATRAEANLAQARLRAARAANIGAAATRDANKAYHEQSGYLQRLAQRMAAVWSIKQVGGFLTSIREVTAEFELQRVSLGAILQDANKGEQIFSQIQQFALKSPISILDLTKYTKQLAAYKIGYDELFDTTKRLADVSVGLGVDFQRLTLLYGQVRATGYLRASEVRQATEAGIPLVEELAAKLTKANGELVTAADVMDMISKRAISFDMVKDVFTDMTSAGGAFYQMQEKQGNTLYGMWAKLGDAASVMYEQIGNTGIVNEGMKEAIQMLTELMRNWKAVGLTAATSILPAVAAMAAWKMATKTLAKSVATATSERIAAEAKLATAMKGTDVAAQNAARSSLAKAKADEAAAIAAQKNATAQNKLKMGFVSLGKTIASGLGIGIAVMLVAQVIYKFYEWITNIRKLKRELDSIYTETATLQDQSVRNFEFLADKAVKAANGSKEQTDALQELNRTYRDILPQEALTIENLAKMKGNYDALTQSIREYIAEQQRQKAESAIMEYYGTKIRDAQNDVRDRLYDQDLSATEIGRFFAEFEKIAPKYGNNVWGAFRDAMIAAGVKDKKRIAEIWKKEFEFTQRDIVSSDTGNANIRALSEAYADQANELKGMNEQYREATGNLGKFSDMQKRVSDAVANATYMTTGGKPVDIDKQGDLLEAMKLNLWVKQTAAEIQNNEDIKKAFAYMGEGIKSEWFNIINVLNSNDLSKVSQINFDAIIASVDNMIAKLGNRNPEILAILNTFRNYLVAQKKEYEQMAPSETVVVRWRNRWKAIVRELQISGQNMNRFLMQSGEDFEVYRKRIKDEVATVIKTIKLLQDAIPNRIAARERGENYTKEQEKKDREELRKAEERKKALEKLLVDLDKISLETDKKAKGGGRSKSGRTPEDLRLQTLQETVSLIEKLYQEYNKYDKLIGSSKALEKVRDIYTESINMVEVASRKLRFKLPKMDVPTNETELVNYLTAVAKIMKTQKGMKGGQKAWVELGIKIDTILSDAQQRRIESELKALADKISRTRTARDFYEKILGMTGDVELAANVSLQIYGGTGRDLKEQIKAQFTKAFEGLESDHADLMPAVTEIINRGAYEELRDYIEKLPEAQRKAAEDLVKAQQQMSVKQYEQWLKDLEKAKDYADKRIELSRYTANQIAAIEERIAKLDPAASDYEQQKAMLEKLIAGYKSREEKEAAKIEYDMFKDMPLYVQMFDNLDNASTTMLNNMLSLLKKNKEQWGQFLDPTQLKEMQGRMNEIEKQLAARNPFKTLSRAFKDWQTLRKSGRNRKDDETAATAAMEAQTQAYNNWVAADKAYQAALKAHGDDTENPEVKAAKKASDAAEEEYKAAKETSEEAQTQAEAWKAIADAIDAANGEIDKYQEKINKAIDEVLSMMETFGVDATDMEFFRSMAEGFNQILDGAQSAAQAFGQFATGYYFNAAMSSVSAITGIASGISNLFSAGKVRKANKEIKRQQELLDQLEYSYSRLEDAANSLFGREYLDNYNKRLKVLQAQQSAYLKQAQAERSKGKKADKEKIKEYEQQARDTADEIQKLQADLVSQIVGTDVASAARDFADAWLEAYLSFGSTTDAIKEKFRDMIKNMVVSQALAGIVQRALQPLFDAIDQRAKDGDLSARDIAEVMATIPDYVEQIDNGMRVGMEALKAAGLDISSLRDTTGEFSGIAKNVASASSEEILQLSGFVNTALFYVSPIPRIDENLAAVRAILERGGSPSLPASAAPRDYTDILTTANQHLSSLPRMERHLAEIHTMLGRVVTSRGGNFGVNTFMK